MASPSVTYLPLHGGHTPRWLWVRMERLAAPLLDILVDEHGPGGLVERLADPFWFQALACILAYDWHSSGTTTVLTGVLRNTLKPEEHGVALAGGKGPRSRNTPDELRERAEEWDLDPEPLVRASRLSAKVDSALVQDGYSLYHHAFFVAREEGGSRWAVVQQGMNSRAKMARRYQWLSGVESFAETPREAITGDSSHPQVLDMTARASEEARRVSLDLVRGSVAELQRGLGLLLRKGGQAGLERWTGEGVARPGTEEPWTLPRQLNWGALRRAYDLQPRNYDEFIATPEIGPATVRALALVSEFLHGARPSWRDPVRFSFAFGGKDGVPHPVERERMDEATQVLKEAVERAKLGDRERLGLLKRLREFAPPVRVSRAF
ncbi:MAG: DUF763 domain-containing protein [Halobacteria archaeon]